MADNATSGEVLRDIVQLAGPRVILLRNGADALRTCVQNGFDLVLVDLRMPLMDGFDLLKRLRALESAGRLAPPTRLPRLWSSLPVVAVTASAVRGDRERPLAAGVDDFLRKPVEIASVQTLLRHWMGSRRGPRSY